MLSANEFEGEFNSVYFKNHGLMLMSGATDGRSPGVETPLGEGQVDFEALIRGLKALGYDGAITVEREISGEEQTADIIKAKSLLEKWMA